MSDCEVVIERRTRVSESASVYWLDTDDATQAMQTIAGPCRSLTSRLELVWAQRAPIPRRSFAALGDDGLEEGLLRLGARLWYGRSSI